VTTRISATATQGSANAFVDSEVTTGLSGTSGRGLQIQRINFEAPEIENSDNDDWEVALSRRAKSAMPLVTDIDVIRKWKILMSVGAAGTWASNQIIEWVPTYDVFIVEDPLHLLVDSTGLAGAQTVSMEIFCELVTISDIDRLTILTQSLTDV